MTVTTLLTGYHQRAYPTDQPCRLGTTKDLSTLIDQRLRY